MPKPSSLLVAPIACLVLAGCCAEAPEPNFENDADQIGEAASNAANTAVDATKKGVHDAAQGIADETSD